MNSVRTRFAPSPTGIMHIGNVRAALFCYLFAKQKNGTFVLRIEDTDNQRNIEDGTFHIIRHLNWLKLNFTEGPEIGGEFGPYIQSQRTEIYQKHLQWLQEHNFVYRCFCTPEELEIRRKRQIAMKKPPRYEGTCLKLSEEEIKENLNKKVAHIWRMKIDHTQKITFKDLARKTLEFDLQHFSDFPLTRENGSFTFIFANCIDDHEMQISHVFRGEEHLSNTVNQVALYKALNFEIPIFWHLPLLYNQEGKKLSKRDRGFSLDDLELQGFIPEAICNYLGILGASFENEIMSLDQLAQVLKFDHLHASSQIRYDMDKLRWINHKWITSYSLEELVGHCKPLLSAAYDLTNTSEQTLSMLIKSIQTDMHTLVECTELLKFYFQKPTLQFDKISQYLEIEKLNTLSKIFKNQTPPTSWNELLSTIKPIVAQEGIIDKELFGAVRILLTGSPKGMQINELFICLGAKEFFNRLCNIS